MTIRDKKFLHVKKKQSKHYIAIHIRGVRTCYTHMCADMPVSVSPLQRPDRECYFVLFSTLFLVVVIWLIFVFLFS